MTSEGSDQWADFFESLDPYLDDEEEDEVKPVSIMGLTKDVTTVMQELMKLKRRVRTLEASMAAVSVPAMPTVGPPVPSVPVPLVGVRLDLGRAIRLAESLRESTEVLPLDMVVMLAELVGMLKGVESMLQPADTDADMNDRP